MQGDASPAPHLTHWDYERSLAATSRFLSMTHESKPAAARLPYDQPSAEDGRASRVAGRSVTNTIQLPTVPILDDAGLPDRPSSCGGGLPETRQTVAAPGGA